MSKVFVTGDIHGDKWALKERIDKCKDVTENDYLIICGDFGAEYGSRIMGSLKKECKKFPGKIIVLRGNHDNRYWAEHTETIETYNNYIQKPLQGWETNTYEDLIYQKKYDNILYIKDEGGIYDIGDFRILFIPGAYSVDKDYRLKNNLPYNPQEQLSYLEEINLLQMIDIYKEVDFVISHTAPLFLEPYFIDLFLSFINQDNVDKHTEKFLEEIYTTLGVSNFKHWFFGHYHDDRKVQQKFTMLYNYVVELGDYIERE